MKNFNSNTNTGAQTTEIYIKEILAGNAAHVRGQLIEAVESLGYDIIEDEPHIIGRRGAENWGTWYGSADVLDYARTLTIRLKSVGANSTRVTFDYLVKHPMLNKGEKSIVAQEARTIAAICRQSVERICPACETESTDDSRFCRRCGTPLTIELAEREVLRMMAEVRAAKTSVVMATVNTTLLIALLIPIIMLLALNSFNPTDRIVLIGLFVLSGLITAVAILSNGFGWNRINRALKKAESSNQPLPRSISKAFQTGEFDELPASKPIASITEGTTNLLDKEWANQREREKIPVAVKRETNNLN